MGPCDHRTRKNQIGDTEWKIAPKHKDDTRPEVLDLAEDVSRLLRHPSMHGSRPNSRSWRQFIGEVLEDILVLDAGCIEKERDGNGWIVAMYPVDGGTIRPNIDMHGGFPDNAYVQIVDGTVTANFGVEDLIYIMASPQTDVRFAGYGYSPLEHMIVSVTAELYSSKYNSSYFEKGAVPEGLLNLGEDCAPEDVDAFRLYWMNEIMGKPWSIPIVAGKGVSWEQWRSSNRDMQFMEYQLWLAKKMCAVYQIAPQDVGLIEDVNRSTADSQAVNSADKGLTPVLSPSARLHPDGGHRPTRARPRGISSSSTGSLRTRTRRSSTSGSRSGVRTAWRRARSGARPSTWSPATTRAWTCTSCPWSCSRYRARRTRRSWARTPSRNTAAADRAADAARSRDGRARGVPGKPGLPASHPLAGAAAAFAKPGSGMPAGGIGKTPAPVVGKVSEDRNPALTDQQRRMEEVWDEHTDTLMRDLAEILEVGKSRTPSLVPVEDVNVDTNTQRVIDRDKVTAMILAKAWRTRSRSTNTTTTRCGS